MGSMKDGKRMANKPTKFRSVSQSGSGDSTIREDVQNVSQTGCGDLILNGNVAGNVHQAGSGDLTINGHVKGNVTQVGCGDIHIRGDVQGNICQMGSGDIQVNGSVHGQVSKNGNGDIRIRRVRRNSVKNGSGEGQIGNMVRANVEQRVYGIPQICDYYKNVIETRSMRLLTGGVRRVKENTQTCARIVTVNARKLIHSGVQMVYSRMGAFSSNLCQMPTKSVQDKKSSLHQVDDKELQCPVCLDIPEKEIYQCKNGHMICASCCSKVDKCPQCRCDLKVDGTLIRNRVAESLIAKI